MADAERMRRFLRAWDIVAEAGRLDEYEAEIRRTQPPHGIYEMTIGQRLNTRDMARRIPEDFGTLEEREAAVAEHWVGSRGLTALAAIETVAREVIEDRQAKPTAADEEPQEQPPEPPSDWMPGEQGGRPIEIKSAAAVPDAVRRAQARRAIGK